MRILLIISLFVISIFADNYIFNPDLNLDINLSNKVVEKNDINNTGEILWERNHTEENISYDIIDGDYHNMKIAVILNKRKFFQYIPSLMNSMNAYILAKDIKYTISLFDKSKDFQSQLDYITQNYDYIFIYLTKENEIKYLNQYPNNYFFIPTLNRSQIMSIIPSNNIFFGGLDYKKQVMQLNQYVDDKVVIFYEDNDLSQYVTSLIDMNLSFSLDRDIVQYPLKYSINCNNSYVYLNTKVVDSAQILSNFSYKKIKTKSILSTQLNYSPLLFSLTTSYDVRNMIIANSILNVPVYIEDNNLNLNSDIDFNWLNFTSDVLLNLAYNIEVDNMIDNLNDFNLHLYYNQVYYKSNLYKIFQNGFIKIEN